MATRKFRLVEIKPGAPLPELFTGELTPEEEAEILKMAKEAYDPVAGEAELKELLRQRELGLLVSDEELFRDLEAAVAADRQAGEKST